jgi:hypothetical protein
VILDVDADSLQLQLNDEARADALAEFGAFTAVQLETADPTAQPGTVDRWLDDGRVFAVDAPGGPLFPAFQFAGAEPLPVIAKVLAAFADHLHGWEILMWFTGSSGYLDGARPVDGLTDFPDEVVSAAAYQASLSTD